MSHHIKHDGHEPDIIDPSRSGTSPRPSVPSGVSQVQPVPAADPPPHVAAPASPADPAGEQRARGNQFDALVAKVRDTSRVGDSVNVLILGIIDALGPNCGDVVADLRASLPALMEAVPMRTPAAGL